MFRSLLRFLYTGRVTEEILQSKCEELMALADKCERSLVLLVLFLTPSS